MNSLFQQLQNSQMQQQQIPQKSLMSKNNLNLVKSFLNSSSPQQFIQTMAMNNPKMQNVLQIFQNSNLSPKAFFYQYAQKNGIDPDQFLNSLKE